MKIKPYVIRQFRVKALAETIAPERMTMMDTPDRVESVWRQATEPVLDVSVENLVVYALNTRRRLIGWYLVAQGTMDTILCHPRETFRAAIIMQAAAIIMAHNHPSGDPAPSESDIKLTRDIMRGGQLLKVELLDHVVMGHPTTKRVSLRELGYLC